MKSRLIGKDSDAGNCLTYIKARQKTFFYAKKKKNAKPLRSQR